MLARMALIASMLALDGGTVEDVALVDVDQLAQGVFRQDQRAEQLDVGDLVDLAFLHAGVDVHRALVRRDRHLGGVDAEVGIAAVHVVGLQLLQVAGELLARVLVVLRVPRQSVGRVRFETVADRLSVKAWLPTMLISLIFAALPSRISMSMATRLRSSWVTCGIDRHVVLAAVVVLADQLLLHVVQRQAGRRFHLRSGRSPSGPCAGRLP